MSEGDSRRTFQLKIPDNVVSEIEQQNTSINLLEKKNSKFKTNLYYPMQNLSYCSDWSHLQTYY
jgi:hypothetical protein